MFFSSSYDLLKIIIVGPLSYFLLILFLRMSGKRTLSKMNAFDYVITVALGSTLATILLSKDISLVEGGVALLTLILLQFIITWLSIRFKFISKGIKATPAILYFKGEFLNETMSRSRISKEEILQAIRENGLGDMDDVSAVVLETTGILSVIESNGTDNLSALNGLIHSSQLR